MGQAGEVFVNFGANTQGLLAGTARAGNVLQRFSQTGVGAAIVLGASFVTLARTMTNFVSSTVSGFKEFDYNITRAKALSGATTEEFAKMTDVAIELGRTTEWMAKDVAQGMSNLALAGFKANEIVAMIPESLRLATAGGINLSKTNTIMANAMRAFSLEADQANQVSNVLTATFTTTNTTLEGLSQTLKNAAGVLATVGVKIEEIASAAGVLGDVGILASVAGTGLKNYGIKLAKTFGIQKDATKSAKEYFEALGVTKDRLFDAETGTFNMVEATLAFKEAMDKLGKSKAPEFLAQFSTLFGERAAVSLTALVRKAEEFKVQAQNVRMTEMIGDVQQVFEELRVIGNQTAYMDNIQEGLNNSVRDMVSGLSDANIYMEEFTDSGEGAAGVISRLSKSFKTTQKILQDTFGTDVFGVTKDGLITINEYGKRSAVAMVELDKVMTELSKKDIGSKRRTELDEERKRLEELVITGKKDVSQLTDQGRARLINLASLNKYINSLKESNDGTSKSVNQIKTLNEIFKGNAQNVAIAARAFGIHLAVNEKMPSALNDVSKEMDKIADSADAQRYSMQRLTSQVAMTNTAMDMQGIQLETLDGIFKIFQSGIELVSNKIAKALSPALGAVIQSTTSFMRALTLSNDEIDRGITATDKFQDAWRETLKIFTDGEGIFIRIKKSFDGLSSIGKTLALVMGFLGAAGLAAGGAFIWVQALLPAISAMSAIFFSIVVPISILVGIAIKLGLSFKKAYDQAKMLGDISSSSIDEIVTAYNSLEGVVKGFNNTIDDLDAQMIKIWSNVSGSIDKTKNQLNNLMLPLEKIAGLTNSISVTGGRLTLFSKDNNSIVIKDTLETINGLMLKLGDVSEEQQNKIRAAIKAGDPSMINALLAETPGMIDAITEAGMKMTIFRKDQDTKSSKFKKDLKEMGIILNGLEISADDQAKAFKKALDSNNIEKLNNILKSTPDLMSKIKEAGIDVTLLDPTVNDNTITLNDTLRKLKQRMEGIKSISEEDRIALMKAFEANNIEEVNNLLDKNKNLLGIIYKEGLRIGFSTETQQKRFKDLNTLIQGRKEIQDQVNKSLSDEIAKNDKSIDSQDRIKNLKKEASRLDREINNFLIERIKLEEDIKTGRGRTAKLNDNEVETLKKLQNAINQRSISVGKLRMAQERLLTLQKNGVDVTKDLLKVNTDLGREHGLLVEKQKAYNKILNDASSLNPFTIAIRAMRELANSKKVKEVILEVSKLVGNTFKYVSDELIPRIINVSNELFKMIKSASQGTMSPIFKLIKSMGGLIGDIIKYSLDAISTLFNYINSEGNNAFSGIGNGINGLANMIDSIRSRVKPFMEFMSIVLIVLYETIKTIITKIGPPIINLLKSLGNLFASVFGAMGRIFEDVFGKIEGKSINVLDMIAIAINKVAEIINKVANAINNTNVGELEKLGIIGLGIFAAFTLVSKVFAFIPMVMSRFNSLSGIISSFNGKINKMLSPLLKGKTLFGAIGEVATKALSFISSNLLLVGSILAGAIILIGSLYESWKQNLANIRGATKGFIGNVMELIGIIISSVVKMVSKIMALVGSVIKLLFNIGKALAPIIAPIVSLVLNIASIVVKILSRTIKIIMDILNWLIQTITNIINSEFVQSLISTIGDVVQMIYDVIGGIFNAIKAFIGFFMELISPVTNFISDIMNKVDGKISGIINKIMTVIGRLWNVLVGYLTMWLQMIGGVAKVVSGIFTFDVDKIRDGLSQVFEAVSGMVIKIYAFVAEIFGTKLPSVLVEAFFGVFAWVAEQVGKLFGWIPKIGGDIKKKMEEVSNSSKDIGKTLAIGMQGKVDESVNFLKDEIGIMGDLIRGREKETGKAKSVVDKAKESKFNIKKSVDDKNKENQDIKKQGQFNAQIIKDLDTTMKDVGSKVEENSKSKPNITNNTYVEYRAAEDDEVNRRMIERVMNDILKADIGLVMGDTAGFNAAD